MNDLAGRTVAVLGLGASGAGAARLARRRGADATVLDSGTGDRVAAAADELRREGIGAVTGPAALERGTDGFDLCVLSPGIDPTWPMPQAFAAAGITIVGEIEFAFQAVGAAPVVAITGTNGKSTTTELVARLLQSGGFKSVPSGNHGRAFSDVLQSGEPIDVHTVEVSSFQLETTGTFRPKVAVWMNFAPDHLDRHPTVDAYFEAKARIFENQTADDWAVLKWEDRRPAELKARVLTFSAFSDAADFALVDGWIALRGEKVVDFSRTHLRGRHNAENLMAALAVGHIFGIPWDVLAESARDYRAPRHRCELVAVVNGREFINDSKATNLHALESCLRALDKPVVLIAGGKQKGLDFAPLAGLAKQCTTHVLAIGQLREHLQQAWGGVVPVEPCEDLESAVRRSLEVSQPGQIVLLSPGTSSFDMFSGYEHRGIAFENAVKRLLSPV